MWTASCCPCTDMPVRSCGVILFAVEKQAYHSKRVCSSNDSIVLLLPRARPFLSRMRSWHLGSKCSGSKVSGHGPSCQSASRPATYTGRLLSNYVLPRGVLLRCARTLAPVWFAGCGFEPAAPLRGRALSIGSSRTKKYRHVPPLFKNAHTQTDGNFINTDGPIT